MTKTLRAYSKSEEVLSSVVHGVGVVLGIVGLVVLVVFSSMYKDAWAITGTAIFGVSIIVMYLASTLYHAITNEHIKPFLKKMDHIAIYYLIAGSYTPFLLVAMRSPTAWVIFGIIWTLAITGTILKLCLKTNGAKLWSVGMYVGMGWLIIAVIGKLIVVMPTNALVFLALGGLAYTLGVIFYVWKSKPYTHAIWHLFVLAGTIFHFFAVLYSCAI